MKENRSLFKKKFRAVLLGITTMIAFSSCGLLSDSGTDAHVDLVKEDYLAVDLLEDASGNSSSADTYKVETYEVRVGTFETQATGLRAEVYVPTEVYVKAEVNTKAMLFSSFAVKVNDYVEEGDVIAYVTVDYDDIELEDAELTLSRLKASYEEAKAEHDKYVQSDRSGPFYLNEYDYAVMEKRWKIEDLTWEKTCKDYDKQIADQTKKVKELKENAEVTAITADCSGYVSELTRLKENDKLSNGDKICKLVPTDQVYVSINDATQSFNYGQKYTFSTETRSGLKTEYDAVVVSAPSKALYCNLTGPDAYLKVDMKRSVNFGWNRSHVEGTLRHIENVLLVPFDAVSTVDETTYVTAIKADGTLETVPFVAGGYNKDFYWVISGIEEGTTIIRNQ